MRRPVSISLLAVLSWMLIVPFFGSDPETSLPPCCRRHGKHHCMMTQWMSGAPGGPARVSGTCPYRQKSGGAVASRSSKPEAEKRPLTEAVWPATLPMPGLAPSHPELFDTHPKRGPPAILA